MHLLVIRNNGFYIDKAIIQDLMTQSTNSELVGSKNSIGGYKMFHIYQFSSLSQPYFY